jgi:hypothetical protein
MNELRKKDISLGLFEYNELTIEEKKMCPDPKELRIVSNLKDEISSY